MSTMHRFLWVALALLLAGCAPVTVNVNTAATNPPPTAAPSVASVQPTTPATSAPAATDTVAPTAANPGVTDGPPTQPAPTAVAPTDFPPETAVPGSGTAVPERVPTSAANSSGVVYTLIFTEAQINTLLAQALDASPANYVSSAGVSLQNGQISQSATFSGPGGTTVNGNLTVAVSASNGDLNVTVVNATIGKFNMPEATKAAISAAFEQALESALAAAHDYNYVDSVTIADGVMVVRYH
jgi:hypothetical protein